jgi:hypothetical protein
MKFNPKMYYKFPQCGKDTIQKLQIKQLPLVPHGLLLDMKFSSGINPP